MSEDLLNELEAINSIYGEKTIQRAEDPNVYILSIPHLGATLRTLFPSSYPGHPPDILGTETVANTSQKGHGAHVVEHVRETLQRVFTPGSVCLFDLLQGLEDDLHFQSQDFMGTKVDRPPTNENDGPTGERNTHGPSQLPPMFPPPSWTLSETVTLKKSVFVARACTVSSPLEAHTALANLPATDKRSAKATHNINAYRIRSQSASDPKSPSNEITYQDCDDDGETAAGGRLLHLLQVMDVWDVFVVVTRWYGGVQLGPDRFRIISQVARDAVVAGGWTKGGGRLPS